MPPEERGIWTENYIKLVVGFEEFADQVEEVIKSNAAQGSFAAAVSADTPTHYAFVFCSSYLASAIDAFRTLHRASLAEPGSFGTGIHATGGLARQGLESAAHAVWIMRARTPEDLAARGFAARWDDLYWQAEFRKATGVKAEVAKNDHVRSQAVALGREHGLITGKASKPIVQLPGKLALCDQLLADPDVIDEGSLREVPGLRNANMLYQWSSGMVHGKSWSMLMNNPRVVLERVHEVESKFIPTGEILIDPSPDYFMLALTLFAALQAANETAARLRGLKTAWF